MQIPLHLSVIDLYRHRGSQDQLQLERRVLLSELSKKIEFNPYCDPLATRLYVLYKSTIENEGANAETRKGWSDYLIVHRDYQQDPHLRLIILCFYVVTERSPVSIAELAVVQVKCIIDYQLLSQSLSQKPPWPEIGQFLNDKKLREAYRELRRKYLSSRKAYLYPKTTEYTLLPEGHKGLPKNFISLAKTTKRLEKRNKNTDYRFDTYHFVEGIPSKPVEQLRLWSLEQTKLKAIAEPREKKSAFRVSLRTIVTEAEDKKKIQASPSLFSSAFGSSLPFELPDNYLSAPAKWPVYPLSKEEKKALEKQAENRAEDKTKKVNASILTSLIKDVHQLPNRSFPVIENALTHFNSKEYFEVYSRAIGYLKGGDREHRDNNTRQLESLVNSERIVDLLKELGKSYIGEQNAQDVLLSFESLPNLEEHFGEYSRAVKGVEEGDKVLLEEKDKERKIVSFLKGATTLSELHVTEENAQHVLLAIKAVDKALSNSRRLFFKKKTSYLIRQHILQMGSSAITTCAVFTYSPYPEIYTHLDYLMNPKNWINERVVAQTKLIIDYNILAHSLSQIIKPLVVATRGNTGVGKSFWVHRFIGEYLKENIQLEEGVLNPDLIKARLKKMANRDLLNSQVYAEGRVLFERFLETLTQQISNILGTVIDTRLLTIEEFRQVLAFAQLRGAHLEVIDVDAPIWNSIASVLNREPFCKDPCVPFEVIKDGFVRSRKYRAEFIEASCREGVNYSLYRANGSGQFTLVAENRHHQFTLIDEGFEGYLKMPLEQEMDAIGDTDITEAFIEQLDLPTGKKQVFMQWRGYTIKEALQRHSEGKAP